MSQKCKQVSFESHHDYGRSHGGLTTDCSTSWVPESDFHTHHGWHNRWHGHSSSSNMVVRPDKPVDGMSQADWGDFWWKKIGTTPKQTNPLSSDYHFRKTGSVQMLVGTSGGDPVERSIRVDNQTYLFAPVFNLAIDNVGFPTDWREEHSRYYTEAMMKAIDPTGTLFYEVNGRSVIDSDDWWQYRQQSSSSFSFVVPKNHINDYPAGEVADYAVSDGYWVMLKPLPVGDHTIHFGATISFSFVVPKNHINDYPAGEVADYAVSDGYWVMLKPLPVGDHTIHFGATIDLSGIEVTDLDGDTKIGIAGITNYTSTQLVEEILLGAKSSKPFTVDVTYQVQVTPAQRIPRCLDLSALAT